MKTIRQAPTGILAVVLTVSGCGGDRAAADGDVGREITIAVQPDTLVDTASGLIGAVADLHVGDDGRVYVSDPQANGVHVFDASGRQVRTIGREGEGPGEFRRLGGLQTLGDTLVVVDGGNGRLQLLSLHGEPLATRPVAVGYFGFTVGPNGLLVRSTLGIDSVLAVAYGMDGKERMRLGEVLTAPPASVNLSAMKREIANGEVPAVFLNAAQSAVDDSGHVWLYMTAAAQVERYDPAGVRVLAVQLAEPEFDAVRTRFVSRNAEMEPNSVFPLRYLLRARAVGSDLWILIDADPADPATILILSENGQIKTRLRFTQVHGAGDFAVDRVRGFVYFYVPDLAELLRLAVPVDAPSANQST